MVSRCRKQPQDMKLIFVYGTLKRGGSNHHVMNGQRFVTEARTEGRYALYDLGGYPGMVLSDDDPLSIMGEVWEVDDQGLQRLDELEGLDVGEYRRVPVPLVAPHEALVVEGYEYLLDVSRAPRLGENWPVA